MNGNENIDVGSSPLTRGKRGELLPRGGGRGLIPAHAGKTSMVSARPPPSGAHPRSRGENVSPRPSPPSEAGSSPLTRGKRHEPREGRAGRGLIPAHAGKTRSRLGAVTSSRAHPRSRGENFPARTSTYLPAGSSPLTRGKRQSVACNTGTSGLIPAHAGKTRHTALLKRLTRAHPRSRGENIDREVRKMITSGSSPLTRGKLGPGGPSCRGSGLIPAHAGKTSLQLLSN